MATKPEFAAFVCDQLRGAGIVESRKMFGEYGLYLDGKFFALICDNTLFIKITDAAETLMPGLTKAPPYSGAKPYWRCDEVDDRESLCHLACVTCETLPETKPRRKRGAQKSDGHKN